jgi:hypothetical protein
MKEKAQELESHQYRCKPTGIDEIQALVPLPVFIL